MVYKTSLKSLGLVSLESIENGNVVVGGNKQLCYLDNIPWQELLKSANQTRVLRGNMNRDHCGECRLHLKLIHFSLLHPSAPLFYSRNSQNSVQNIHVYISCKRLLVK